MVKGWKSSNEQKTKYEKQADFKLLVCVAMPLIVVIIAISCLKNELRDLTICILDKIGDSQNIITNLQDEKDFVGTAVWTLTTILSAFIILYYSALGTRNFGITNRKIISYAYGSFFIPYLIVLNALIVVAMTVCYYVDFDIEFYIMVVYSFCLQAVLCALCVYSTTRYKAYKTILKIEKSQLVDMLDNSENIKSHKVGVTDRKSGLTYHLDSVLRWDEPMSEKREIIKNILLIPFRIEQEGRISDSKIIYTYQYHNFRLLIFYIKEQIKDYNDISDVKEISDIYEIIYKVFEEIEMHKMTSKSSIWEISRYYSSLFNAFVSENWLSNRWDFLSYIINEIVKNMKIKQILLIELLMSIQFQIAIKNILIENTEEIDLLIRKVRNLKGFDQIRINLVALLQKNEEWFRLLLFSWLAQTTITQRDKYLIWEEIYKGLLGRGRHDVMDFLLRM